MGFGLDVRRCFPCAHLRRDLNPVVRVFLFCRQRGPLPSPENGSEHRSELLLSQLNKRDHCRPRGLAAAGNREDAPDRAGLEWIRPLKRESLDIPLSAVILTYGGYGLDLRDAKAVVLGNAFGMQGFLSQRLDAEIMTVKKFTMKRCKNCGLMFQPVSWIDCRSIGACSDKCAGIVYWDGVFSGFM